MLRLRPWLATLAVALAVVPACVPAAPGAPGASAVRAKDVVGTVDLFEPDEVEDAMPWVANLAPSTVVLLSKWQIDAVAGPDGYRVLNSTSPREQLEGQLGGGQYCERLSTMLDERQWGSCSGALVAPDLVLTAGHCVRSSWDCQDYQYVTDHRGSTEGTSTTIDPDHMHRCAALVARAFASRNGDARSGPDFALVQIDPPVTDRTPFEVADAPEDPEVPFADNGRAVALLGYPVGMPVKVMDNGVVTDHTAPGFASTDLDSFRGTSGGPVVDATTGRLLGLNTLGTAGTDPTSPFAWRDQTDGVGRCLGWDRGPSTRVNTTFTMADVFGDIIAAWQSGAKLAVAHDFDENGGRPLPTLAEGGETFELSVGTGRVVSVVLEFVGWREPGLEDDVFASVEHGGVQEEVDWGPQVWAPAGMAQSQLVRGFEGLDADGSWKVTLADRRGDADTEFRHVFLRVLVE